MRYLSEDDEDVDDWEEWDTDELGIDPEELYDDATDDFLDSDDG